MVLGVLFAPSRPHSQVRNAEAKKLCKEQETKEITEVGAENAWLQSPCTARQGNARAMHCIREGRDVGTAVENSWKSAAAPNCSQQNMVPGVAVAADTSVCRVQAGSAASWAESSLLCNFSVFYLPLRYPKAEPSPTSATTSLWVASDASSAQREMAMRAAAVYQRGHGLGGGCHRTGLSHTSLPVAPRRVLVSAITHSCPLWRHRLDYSDVSQKTFTKAAPWGGGAGSLQHSGNNSHSSAKSM